MAIIAYDAARPTSDGIIRTLRTLKSRDKQAEPTSPKRPDPKADPTIADSTPQNASEAETRFWNETATPPVLPASTPIPSSQKSHSSSSAYRKPSIAAATIIGVLVVAAITFLSFYYIRREKRARRLRRLEEQSHTQDPFGQSSLSLTAETSKALDDFLMKEVKPERTSLMFSRSPSPSLTYVVDETDRRSNRNSYNASASSLHKIETLARVSNERTRWSSRSSEHSSSSLREAQAMLQPSGPASGPASPRLSMSSTRPTARSFRLSLSSPEELTPSTTTTDSTLQSQETTSPRSSQSISRMSGVLKSPNILDSGISLLTFPSAASRSSHASSRLSAQSIPRTDPRTINNAGGLRRSHARSRSHSFSQSNISPIAESLSLDSGSALESGSALGSSLQLPSDRSTPSPMFRLSEG